MLTRCSSSRRARPASSRRPAGALLLAASLALLSHPAAAAAGVVGGTVRVEQATIRADGPKNDRDVVVMLDPVGAPAPPPADGLATMDQRGLLFLPHVLAIQKGSKVRFLNNDPDPHNVYFLDEETGQTLDIGTYARGVSVDHRFTKEGSVIVLCRLHLEMAAYVVVANSPWFTTARLDPEGQPAAFRIENVPAGEYRVTVWHKKLRPIGLAERVVVPASGGADVPVVLTKASRVKKRK